MCDAGAATMLELMARIRPAVAGGTGAQQEVRSKGAVMAGMDGRAARTVVAVIGAGIMGSAMARNLAAAGLDTRVWDRSPAATAALAGAGAVAAATAPDAVRDAAVVITMLPTAAAVESVIFDGGVAAAFADGSVWAQMGTIGVEATLGFRDRLAAARPGVTFVDAPVSGSKGPAEQGQLLILASGHQQLADVIEGGPLDAPLAGAKLHKMDRGDYAPEFPLEWALKDVDLAISAAGGEAPPLLAALSGQWHAAVAAGHGRQDISAARLALPT
jgi:3-hydroxyisobutyrate dehydrogenase